MFNPVSPLSQAQRGVWQFLRFLVLSGMGWLCDFATFTLLVKLFGVSGFVSNFVSSYVGVTFVWFTSLNTVFGRTGDSRGRFLFTYWGFQFVSILAYSQLLHWVIDSLFFVGLSGWLGNNSGLVAKVIITPFNLISNFLFMRWLTRFMKYVAPLSES